MPRTARTVIPKVAHHVTQRGNNRQDVFFVDDDRHTYKEILRRESDSCGLRINGYCLMTNHVHLVCEPQEEKSLAKALGLAHMKYTQYLNRMHNRSGHLWQNRFYSCPVEDDILPIVLRYVETNPVRARMVRNPWTYEWSSAAAHTGHKDEDILLDMNMFNRMARPES